MEDILESESFRRYLERQRRISEIRYSEDGQKEEEISYHSSEFSYHSSEFSYHSSELDWLIKQNELSLQILGL